jgi:hypothetical protein
MVEGAKLEGLEDALVIWTGQMNTKEATTDQVA